MDLISLLAYIAISSVNSIITITMCVIKITVLILIVLVKKYIFPKTQGKDNSGGVKKSTN